MSIGYARKLLFMILWLIGSCSLQAAPLMRDGCTKIGGTCDCTHALPPGLPEECYEGMCFQGYHYGDDSVYCQCHGNVMGDKELEDFQKERFAQAQIPDKARLQADLNAKKISYYNTQIPASARVPTDTACAARPKYGYSGRGFTVLVLELKRLADQSRLFQRGSYVLEPGEKPSRFPVDPTTIKAALDLILQQITGELAKLYSLKSTPTEIVPYVKIYEKENRPAEPCMRFKELLKTALNLGPDIIFTKEAGDLISNTCGVATEETKGDLEPCICGNTRKPGLCRVNICVNPGILRCHCD